MPRANAAIPSPICRPPKHRPMTVTNHNVAAVVTPRPLLVGGTPRPPPRRVPTIPHSRAALETERSRRDGVRAVRRESTRVPNKSNNPRLPSGGRRFTPVIVTGGDVEKQLSMYPKSKHNVIESDDEGIKDRRSSPRSGKHTLSTRLTLESVQLGLWCGFVELNLLPPISPWAKAGNPAQIAFPQFHKLLGIWGRTPAHAPV